MYPSRVRCIERTFEIPCLNNTTLRNLFQEVFFRTFVLKRVALFALYYIYTQLTEI